MVNLHHGDCLEVMAGMDPESVDAIVTDPPYNLTNRTVDVMGCEACGRTMGGRDGDPDVCPRCGGALSYQRSRQGRGFMGKTWDGTGVAFRRETWEAAYRVAKPSAYLLAFGGTRTVHRLTTAIEDAGWIIRDLLAWSYASGFPKSKASLKPAWEPIIWARKPFSVPVQWWGDVHHTLAALIWLTEGAPEGDGCASVRVASLFDQSAETATSRSRAVASTSSSIASSWASILDALSADGSRYTTSTASRLTTALRTLSWSLSPVISVTTMPPCGCLHGGSSPSATDAASSSSDEHMRWLDTLRRSVPESAIGPIVRMVAGVCASIAADLSDDLGVAPTALDPATTSPAGRAELRPIVMARKPGPLRELAIDACRIGTGGDGRNAGPGGSGFAKGYEQGSGRVPTDLGRWPANVIATDAIFDGGWDGVVGGGQADSARPYQRNVDGETFLGQMRRPMGPDAVNGYGDSGTYSRFFLVPKADRADREPVLGGLPERTAGVTGRRSVEAGEYDDFVYPAPEGIGAWLRAEREAAGLKQKDVARHFPSKTGGLTGAVANWELEFNRPTPDQWRTLREAIGFDDRYDVVMTTTESVPRELFDDREPPRRRNHHPTVKPTELMRHLVRLVTPTGGIVLDPFLGSGTTAIAAEMEGFDWIGIEKEADYVAISEARLNGTQRGLGLPA